jgi:hypothetical protein
MKAYWYEPHIQSIPYRTKIPQVLGIFILILALIMRSVNTGIGRMTEDLDTLGYDGVVSGGNPEGNHAMRSRWGIPAAIRRGHLEELEHISRSVSLMLEWKNL